MEFYHVLNRGVDKRDIFLNDRDRLRFIHDLFEFNDEVNVTTVNYYAKSTDIGRRESRRERKLLVYIHCFCLMDSHYHLLLSPAIENGISLFMKKLNGGYAKYFNEKYNRQGALFQGRYKKIRIGRQAHFLHIPFYIHLNPLDGFEPKWRLGEIKNTSRVNNFLDTYRWSSHLDYLERKNFPSVTQRKFLKGFFDETGSYKEGFSDFLKLLDEDCFVNINLE